MSVPLSAQDQARLAQIDADIRKWLPEWRLADGLRYVRWAVLDIPDSATLAFHDFHDRLANFVEEPVAHFEGLVFGKRQYVLFFLDTLPEMKPDE